MIKLVYGAIETQASGRGNGCCIPHRDMISALNHLFPGPRTQTCIPASLAGQWQPSAFGNAHTMKILLIEDDKETAAHIVYALQGAGHEVTVCHDGPGGLKAAQDGGHAALIVDRMLPGLDGLSLVRQLRGEGNNVPTLFLTTMTGLNDRVEGLQAGGDDYLVKPFAFPELLARVHAIARRGSPADAEPVRLRAADLEMDLIRRTVHRAGRAIDLQAQEFRLLEYLMRNMGRVVTRAMLLEHVWDLHFDPRTNIVETHMSRLRGKVDRGYAGELIHTVRGSGYILRAE
jgi:two-component system OmpR family response regulator